MNHLAAESSPEEGRNHSHDGGGYILGTLDLSSIVGEDDGAGPGGATYCRVAGGSRGGHLQKGFRRSETVNENGERTEGVRHAGRTAW